MTVQNCIESIFLRVNGGKPNPDNAVWRADIKAMLPAAVNYAMDKTYNLNLQIEGDRDYPSEFYSVFEGVPINWTGNIPFIEMTVGAVPLKGGAGIRFVYDNCQHQYAPLSDADMGSVGYYSDITQGMYWYRETGEKMYLYGLKTNPLIEEINYQIIIRVEDLQPTDELPLQAGSEKDVYELMVQWFMNKLPVNTEVNGNDINAQPI